jgi:hypothetical protein
VCECYVEKSPIFVLSIREISLRVLRSATGWSMRRRAGVEQHVVG